MSEPPYAADTRAKGWRFEIDIEQIERSDTWPLAAEVSMAQHALLMMWLVAWQQEPCGSFPNDEAVIRAKCRVPPGLWAKCRHILMRGWWLAKDGRLYHPTLTKRVTEMLRRRRSDADRQAERRAGLTDDTDPSPPGVTAVSRVTPTGVAVESSTDNRPEKKRNTPKAPKGAVSAFPVGFENFWSAYPRKVGKDSAARAYAKRRFTAEQSATVLEALQAQLRWPAFQREERYVPHASTWLNEGRWQDEPPAKDDGEAPWANAI